MLASITPVILTFNEAANIERTLDALSWATDIVVVDSGSNDETVNIARRYAQVRIFTRPFDTHANQWNYAITETGVKSDWILALDADYVLSDTFVDELRELAPPATTGSYWAAFEYWILGRPLRGSVYPPVRVLFRKSMARYEQDGHTQRLVAEGGTNTLANRIRHDDRKPLSHWIAAQARYAELEAHKLAAAPSAELGVADRIRKMVVVAPWLVFLYVLFVRGTILDGRAGVYYALQRAVAELLLSLHLVQDGVSDARPR